VCTACLEQGTVAFRRGDTVEVKGLEEILATLDADGKLEGLPFMPEMVRHCGRRFRVSRRADKSCVEGLGIRQMTGTVFLEDLRCDGSEHEGCQRGCLLFWKEVWLKSVCPEDATDTLPVPHTDSGRQLKTKMGERFFCQSTELLGATCPLQTSPLIDALRDLTRGEAGYRQILLGQAVRIINKLRKLFGLRPFGELVGRQEKPAKGDLNLQPGQWVEVRSREEIEATLDARSKNRGLSFEPEMTRHCGQRYRVGYPVRKIILEETGKMTELTNTVILEGVGCHGPGGWYCPRNSLFYWRECWLRRVPGPDGKEPT
jgi:hypothetical protein